MGRTVVTDTMPDLNGHRIDNGRLELQETLGSGAYGKVYKALDLTSSVDNPVFYAVKCLLKPEPGSDQEQFQYREFTLHKMVCDHPNVVTLHRIVQDRRFVYVVLDYCPGGDLFASITELRTFQGNVPLIKDTFIQLIDAVHYCHERSIFHRDLKPENVLCTEDGTGIRLADFGLATQNVVSKDFGCGSSYYMSPECIGKELTIGRYSTRHSDIWSLGVILTNMISGRNPWRYATTKDECFAAYLHDRDFLRQVLPISRGANSILKRIFNLNPLCRITLTELREEIIKLDTFFMNEEDLAVASPSLQTIAKAYSQRGKKHEKPVAVIEADPKKQSKQSEDSVSSDEVYAFDSPHDEHASPPPPQSPAVGVPRVCITGTDGASTPVDSHVAGSSGSGSDSDGPITPATYAVEPDVEVPDLPEGETLDEPVITRDPEGVSEFANVRTKGQKVKSGPRRLLRKAFEKIMIASSDSTFA